MLPTLEIPYSFPHKKYLKKHPELIERNRKGEKVYTVCLAELMKDDCPFWKDVEKILDQFIKKHPDIVLWDYEYGIAKPNAAGYSEKNIELFRKIKNISVNKKLAPEDILKNYPKEWEDFRCRQNGGFFKKYKNIIKKINPKCKFMAYSAYQLPSTMTRYGVDWRYIGPHVDIVSCGYGRGRPDATRKAAGKKYLMGGWLVYGRGKNMNQCEKVIFTRLIDCGAFMVFGSFIQDGRFFGAASKAASVAADFEKFFLNLKRNDSLVCSPNGKPLGNAAVLTNGNERLVFLFNRSSKKCDFAFKNLSFPQNTIAIDYDTKQLFKKPSEIKTELEPYKVKIFYFTQKSSAIPMPPRLLKVKSRHWPALRWSDPINSGRHKYILEYSTNSDFEKSELIKNIPNTVFQTGQSILLGEKYFWRVKSVDAVNDKESAWSEVSEFATSEIGENKKDALIKPEKTAIQPSWLNLETWSYPWGTALAEIIKSNSVKHGQSPALKITLPYESYIYGMSWQGAYGSQLVEIKANEECEFSIWTKSNAPNMKIKAGIWFLNKKGVRIRLALGKQIISDKNWSICTVKAKPPKNARSAFLLFHASGKGSIWISGPKFNSKKTPPPSEIVKEKNKTAKH